MKHLLLPCIFFIIACSDSAEQKDRTDGYTPVLKNREDSLYHDVMEGHDVGMAKIGQLKKQLTRVEQYLDSMNKSSTQKSDLQYKQALLNLKEDLSYADNAMFKWMDEFDVDSAKHDKTARITYLESEKLKVTKVRDNILNSLKKADSLLDKR